jgi:hypothetical protein
MHKRPGRPSKTKEQKAKTITLTIPKEVKEKLKLIKQEQKFNASKFFAKKIEELV